MKQHDNLASDLAEFFDPDDPGPGPDDAAEPRLNGESVHLRPGFNPITGDTIEPERLEPLPVLDLAALAVEQPAAPEFAISRIAPAGEVTLFPAPGSAGKSLLAQMLSTAGAAEVPCLRLDIAPGPTIYATCEEAAGQVHWRQVHICRALGVDMASLAGKLHLVSLRGELGNELCTFSSDGRLTPSATYRRLVKTVAESGAKLIFLDNLAHFYTGNENDRGEVTRFVNLLNRLAGETGAAIVLLGHPNKAGDDWSGSTAWLNAVRSAITMDHDLDTDVRTLRVIKSNYDRKGEVCRFVWRDWAFVLEDDLPADEAAALRESVQAAADNKIFLACLRERIKQRRAVSEKRSPTFAPTEFAKMPESKGIGKERLEKALDRLFRIGAIERGFLWVDKGERRPVHGIRETAGNGGDNAENGASNGASNTVRQTPTTVAKSAENRASNAREIHTIPTVYTGAALEAAPPVADEPDYLASWGTKAEKGL
jgi:hypothetical protein